VAALQWATRLLRDNPRNASRLYFAAGAGQSPRCRTAIGAGICIVYRFRRRSRHDLHQAQALGDAARAAQTARPAVGASGRRWGPGRGYAKRRDRSRVYLPDGGDVADLSGIWIRGRRNANRRRDGVLARAQSHEGQAHQLVAEEEIEGPRQRH